MQPIIDVHSHILPGIDDGSRNMEETRELLYLAYSQGIREIIATPHHHGGRLNINPEKVKKLVKDVQREAGHISLDLRIHSGQELFYVDSLVEELSRGKALTLADTNYVLVEFRVESAYETLYQAVRRLVQARYRPILAHIERYRCLRIPGRIQELVKTGALMQMNYGSLSQSMKYVTDRHWCRKMVMEGQIHFLGTDMHRMDFRPPEIQKSTDWLQKKCQEGTFKELVFQNPENLLNGKYYKR